GEADRVAGATPQSPAVLEAERQRLVEGAVAVEPLAIAAEQIPLAAELLVDRQAEAAVALLRLVVELGGAPVGPGVEPEVAARLAVDLLRGELGLHDDHRPAHAAELGTLAGG